MVKVSSTIHTQCILVSLKTGPFHTENICHVSPNSLVLHEAPAQASSAHQPWLFATQPQNTAVQYGLDPATQISSALNFIIQCAWFQAACNPRSSHGCQFSAMLHLLLYVVKRQLTTCFKSLMPIPIGQCMLMYLSIHLQFSTACISKLNMVRHDICRHNCAVERELAIGFCGQPHYCYGLNYPTARFWSPSSYMISDEPFPDR